MKLPARELIPRISEFCCDGNKLHSIYPTVDIITHSKNMSDYDSVLINRLLTD